MSPSCRRLARTIFVGVALFGACTLLGAGTTYVTAYRRARDAQMRGSVWSLRVAHNNRACWDNRFAYQYWWGSDECIDAEYVAVTEVPEDALDTINEPDRPRRWITETLWVWARDQTGHHKWTPDQLSRLTVIEATPGEHHYWGRFAVGWPRRVFECEWRQNLAADGTNQGLKFTLMGTRVEDGHIANGEWIRPTRILLRGAVYNSIVFAAGWGAAFALLAAAAVGARKAQRCWRRSRGHCPTCNYDLHADFTAGCPECGWRRPPPTTLRDSESGNSSAVCHGR